MIMVKIYVLNLINFNKEIWGEVFQNFQNFLNHIYYFAIETFPYKGIQIGKSRKWYSFMTLLFWNIYQDLSVLWDVLVYLSVPTILFHHTQPSFFCCPHKQSFSLKESTQWNYKAIILEEVNSNQGRKNQKSLWLSNFSWESQVKNKK